MLSPVKTNLSRKLRDKEYRAKFFSGRAQDEIAFQLRAARKHRCKNQAELAQLSGTKQSAISRLEQASYSKWNFGTLLRLADALDLRIRVNFDLAEDVIREYELREGVSRSNGFAATMDQSLGAITDEGVSVQDAQGNATLDLTKQELQNLAA